MLRIRLARVGAKRQPSYRIVVANIQSKRDGRIVERIGFYNPRTEPITYKIDEGRALYWLSVGAQPSDAVNRLLAKQGTIDRLGRLRQGEGMDALVAEYEGKPLPTQNEEAAAQPATVVETVKETVAQVVGSAVEAVGEAIETAGEVIAGHPAEETATEEETAVEAEAEEETAVAVEAEPAVAAETAETPEPVAEAATSGEEA